MSLTNLIFPRFCIQCEKNGDYLCKECKKELIPHPEICPYCHRFSVDYKTCLNCKTDKENALEGLIIGFSYRDMLKKLVLKLKYYHKKDIGGFLGERLDLLIQSNPSLQAELSKSIGFISYVPSHRIRHYFIKGYNQSKVLADILAKQIGLPVIDITKKIRFTVSQAGLNRQKRLSNLKNAFKFTNSGTLKGDELIILVDDITTTGATLNELAKTIKSVYPKVKVWGIVVGRHN